MIDIEVVDGAGVIELVVRFRSRNSTPSFPLAVRRRGAFTVRLHGRR